VKGYTILQCRAILSDKKALLSLPDEQLPQTDDIFAANLKNDGADLIKVKAMMERYATKRILPDAIALYPNNKGHWEKPAAVFRNPFTIDPHSVSDQNLMLTENPS
jgi:hypothetical protein